MGRSSRTPTAARLTAPGLMGLCLMASSLLGCARMHAPDRPLVSSDIGVRVGCIELGLFPVHAPVRGSYSSVAYATRALNHCRRTATLDLRRILVFGEDEEHPFEVSDPRGELRPVTLDAFREMRRENLAFVPRLDRRLRRVCVSLEQVAPGAPSTVYCHDHNGVRLTTFASLEEYRRKLLHRIGEDEEPLDPARVQAVRAAKERR